MSAQTRRCHVLHGADGRIVAAAAIAAVRTPEGIEMGMRPVARPHQTLSEIELAGEYAHLALHELLEFEIQTDAVTGKARLQRASKPGA